MRPRKRRTLRLESLERRRLMAAASFSDLANNFAPIADHIAMDLAGGEHHGDSQSWMSAAGTHHDPHLPNFATLPPVGLGVTLAPIESGNWSDVFSDVGPEDTVVIRQNVKLDVDTDVHTIVIADGGRLEISTDGNIELRIVNFQVLSGGSLIAGTKDNPVSGHIEIIFKDVEIDPIRDPGQYGNGLLVQGSIQMHGRTLAQTFTRIGEPITSGQQAIHISENMNDWQVGDQLLLPDSTQIFYTDRTSKKLWRYEELEIAALQEGTIQLTEATSYDHLGAHDADDHLVFLPHVANLTRNIVFRSENAQGTRGHTMMIGRADVDLRYVAFKDLGRTTNGELDNTVFDEAGNAVHFGMNQVSRYPLHLHHLIGTLQGQDTGYQSTIVGNSVSTGKNDQQFRWGIVAHGAHYSLISANIVYNYAGAGIATEDGSESFNMISGNFVSRVDGTRARGKVSNGREGSGLWLRRSNNYVVENVVTGAEKAAYAIYGGDNTAQPAVKIPAFRGADPHMGQYIPVEPESMHLLQFDGNEAYASHMGVEIWYLGFHNYYNPTVLPLQISKINETKLWHINHTAIFGEQANNLEVNNAVIIGDRTTLTQYNVNVGVNLMRAVSTVFNDLQLDNYNIGIETPLRTSPLGSARQIYETPPLIFDGGLVRNWTNFLVQTPMEDASHEAPPKFISIRNVRFSADEEDTGSRRNIKMQYRSGRFSNLIAQDVVEVIGYNGNSGDDFRLYYPQQQADFVIPMTGSMGAVEPNSPIGAPESGLTNEQAWNKYRVAVAGEVAPEEGQLDFPGLIGLAFPLRSKLHPPTITSISPDTGVEGDFVTYQDRLKFSGIARPLSQVMLYQDGVAIAEASTGADGNWEIDYRAVSISTGTHHFTATARLVSEVSDSSNPVGVSIFTHAPVISETSIEVVEDLAVGSVLAELDFYDDDVSDSVQLSFDPESVDGLFSLHSDSGVLTLARDLSAGEFRGTYDIAITATDRTGLHSNGLVKVKVLAQDPGAWIKSLTYRDFPRLTPSEIVHLTSDQLVTIPNRDWFVRIPADSRSALTEVQIQAVNIAPYGMITGFTYNQRQQLTDNQIRSLGSGGLGYIDYGRIPASRITALSPSQLSSIPNLDGFLRLSATARANLTGEQVRGLNMAPLGMITALTNSQAAELSDDQLRSLGGGTLGYLDYSRVPASRIHVLTPNQINAIPDRHGFMRLSADSRAALTVEQVRGLRIGEEGMIAGLSDSQILELSNEQIQSLGFGGFGYLDLARLPSSLMHLLTPAQLGAIPHADGFLRLSSDARSTLSAQQIGGLNVQLTGIISGLNEHQINQLSQEQVQVLTYEDFRYLTGMQVTSLSRDQLLSIPTFEDFSRLSFEARTALEEIGVRWVLGVGIIFG